MMKKSIKFWMVAVMTVLTATAARANDAVYYVNGSHLEPVQETDISVKKEILTINIGDDGFAYVDVDYTFRPGSLQRRQ